MSLKFVTRKLKTQKLEEQEQQQKKLEQVDKFKNEETSDYKTALVAQRQNLLVRSYFQLMV